MQQSFEDAGRIVVNLEASNGFGECRYFRQLPLQEVSNRMLAAPYSTFNPGLGLLSACASHSISYIKQRGHQKTYGMFRLLVHVEWKHVALANALYTAS